MANTTESKTLRCCSVLLFVMLLADAAQADEGPMLQVTADKARIEVTENGVSRTIAGVPKGTRLWAFETKGDFYRVMDPATLEKGWIWNKHAPEAKVSEEDLESSDAAWGESDKADEYEEAEDHTKAKAIFQRILRTTLKALGENHPDTALAQNALGRFYRRIGSNVAAEKAFQKSLATYQSVLGDQHTKTTTAIYALASLYRQMEEYTKAESLLRKCHELEATMLGEEHPEPVLTLNVLARNYMDMAENAKAEPLYKEVLRIRTKVLGPQHEDTLAAASSLIDLYRTQGENDKAVPLLRQSLEAKQKALGEEHLDALNTQNELAVAYHDMGDFGKAESLYKECLRISTKVQGDKHSDALTYLNNLANLYSGQGDNEKTEPLLKKCLEIRVKVSGEEHLDTAIALNRLAKCHQDRCAFEEAESLCQQSLKIQQKLLGDDHQDVATALHQLAALYGNMSDFSMADRLLAQSLKIRKARLGEEHVDIAESLCSLGDSAAQLGEYPRAEEFLTQGVEMYRRLLGAQHPVTCDQVDSLAMLYHTLGDFDRAESLYQTSLDVRRRTFGPEDADVATLLNNIGILHFNRRDFAKAEPLLQQSLDIRRKALGANHTHVGNSLHNLGATYMYSGRYSKARPLMEAALEVFRNVHYGDHTNIAASLSRLALLNQRTAKYSDAESMYGQSVQIYRKLLGNDHPDTITTLNRIANLQLEMKSHGKAIATQDRAMQGARRHLCNVLPALTETQRQKYLASSYVDDFATALSLALECRSDRRAANLSAGWILNGKAAGAEALAEAALLSSEEAAPLVKELRSVRDHIAKISLRASSTVDAATRERLAALESRQQQLRQKIAGFNLGRQTGDPWVTTGALMSEIPFNAVLVNIAKIRRRNFQSHDEDARWLPTRYVAWIVPSAGSGSVKIVDLGESAPIDAKVMEMREQIPKDFKRLKQVGEAQATEELRTATLELSKLLLAPLEESLTEVEELILSPDGELWTLPWDALITQDGSYLIETYRTRYVISGRELVRDVPERALVGAPVIFADANFDLSQDDVLMADTGIQSELRSISNAYFPQLKSSAAEAVSIRPSIDGYTGESSKLFMADECQEASFKDLHRPRVLVVSTHGYVEKPSDPEEGQSKVTSYDYPLLRCGLAFAGANNRKLATQEGKEDGILTGLEIVGIDLRGTELVVLSACQTGLGDVQDGEGVAGLRHAFQLAGARAVISSLWEVEDGATARLINAFFGNLAKGLSKSEALRQAQLSQIESRRGRFGAAHPFFWSAFTLTGE